MGNANISRSEGYPMPHTNIDRASRTPEREVPAVRRLSAAAVFFIAAMFAATAHAQPLVPETPAVQAFESATRDYVRMHRRLESQVGVIHLNITVAELNRIMEELAAAIRAERPDAKQGDFFTPALARELRARELAIPLLVMTAESHAKKWAAAVHADGYLAKPFTGADLLHAVQRFVA